jgi:hypothetical protein
MAIERESKVCVTCGRVMDWRKKWERDWEHVKYCSEGCRKGVGEKDRELEGVILELLSRREKGATICPSEAARAVYPETWREHMEDARRAGRRLVAAGKVVFTQKGRVVEASGARGPVRVRLV